LPRGHSAFQPQKGFSGPGRGERTVLPFLSLAPNTAHNHSHEEEMGGGTAASRLQTGSPGSRLQEAAGAHWLGSRSCVRSVPSRPEGPRLRGRGRARSPWFFCFSCSWARDRSALGKRTASLPTGARRRGWLPAVLHLPKTPAPTRQGTAGSDRRPW
jgi:hypothetical protein